MRSPTSVPKLTFIAEDYDRRKAAIQFARYHLRWLTLDISRWTGVAPDDPKAEFHDAVEMVASILNDPAVDKLLGGQARLAREYFLPVLRQGRPPLRKERGRRTDSRRDRWIAETVARVCQYHGFLPTRSPGADPEDRGNECGSSIVAKVLAELGINLSEKRVASIFGKYWIKVKEPPGPEGAVKYVRRRPATFSSK
jgi:hypothetical protein